MTSTLEPDEIPDADLDRVAGGTGVLASNNAAILAQRPTVLSILPGQRHGNSTRSRVFQQWDADLFSGGPGQLRIRLTPGDVGQ